MAPSHDLSLRLELVRLTRGSGGLRLAIADGVDSTTIVEVEGRKFPLAHVVRAIHRRSVVEIHHELRAVQASGVGGMSRRSRTGASLFRMLPGFLRRLLCGAILRFPRFAKRHTGTLLVFAVGIFGSGSAGWGLSAPGIHDLSIVIGTIAQRAAADSSAEAREVLCLTVSANHELVDGGPKARFARELARLVSAATIR